MNTNINGVVYDNLVNGKIRIHLNGRSPMGKDERLYPSYVTTWEEYHAEQERKANQREEFEQAYVKTMWECFPELAKLMWEDQQ